MFPFLFAQFDQQPQPQVDLGPLPAIVGVIELVLAVLLLVSYWRVFTKAGEPGWAVLIPIYNVIVYLRIVGRPWWWLLLFLIPFVGFIILLITLYDLAKSFGHGVGYFIGLIFLSFIFVPMIAFGDSRYQGPAAA